MNFQGNFMQFFIWDFVDRDISGFRERITKNILITENTTLCLAGRVFFNCFRISQWYEHCMLRAAADWASNESDGGPVYVILPMRSEQCMSRALNEWAASGGQMTPVCMGDSAWAKKAVLPWVEQA